MNVEILSLTKNNIGTYLPLLPQYYNLRSLYLSDIDLSQLQISYLPIQELHISNVRVNNFYIFDLPNLNTLTITHNAIENLSLSNLFTLRTLDGVSNAIKKVQFQNMNNMEYLSFPNNQITSVIIKNLPRVKFLNFPDNNLTTFDFHSCFNIQAVYLQNNSFQSLKIANHTNLDFINLSDNKYLHKLKLVNLPNLLDYDSKNCNELKKLVFNNITKLREFHSNKIITHLKLYNLENLQKIISGNFSQIVDISLENLPALQNLDIENNIKLKKLSVTNCANISQISVNRCSTLDEVNLYKLPALLTVELVNCSIRTLNLQQLNNLQSLNCRNNFIRELDLRTFPNLRNLNCAFNNSLYSLNVTGLNHLANVNITATDLQTLPFSVRQFIDITLVYDEWRINLTPEQQRIVDRRKNLKLKSVSNDKQSTHIADVINSLKQSYHRIKNKYQPHPNVLKAIEHNDFLRDNGAYKIVKKNIKNYNTKSSIFNDTYETVLSYVYPLHNENSYEILAKEIKDSDAICYIGTMNSLVHSLVGIVDEVKIELSMEEMVKEIASETIRDKNIPDDKKYHAFMERVLALYPYVDEKFLQPYLDVFIDLDFNKMALRMQENKSIPEEDKYHVLLKEMQNKYGYKSEEELLEWLGQFIKK
jgi:hypothetical protein